MAAPEIGMTMIVLGCPCEWSLALQRSIVWEHWWYWLPQMMTLPLHCLQLQQRVVFCYPHGAMLMDFTPSLPPPAAVAGSLTAPSAELVCWAPGSDL
jgi:hypothetical protein